MNFPKNKTIEKVLKKLESAEATLVINYEKALKSDVLKYKICQEFVKILKSENITQVELASRLNIDKAIVNKIILHRIEHFTVDRLLDLLAKLKKVDVLLNAS